MFDGSTWGLALNLLDRNVEYRPALCHREGCGNKLRPSQEIYCSKRCSAIENNANRELRPKPVYERNGPVKNCQQCGKQFVAHKDRNTFCSVDCFKEHRRKDMHVCPVCNQRIESKNVTVSGVCRACR